MANLSLKGVTKFYDKAINPAVSDFNLEIADKEFIVFLVRLVVVSLLLCV